jgi:hypothetical protein
VDRQSLIHRLVARKLSPAGPGQAPAAAKDFCVCMAAAAAPRPAAPAPKG